MVVYEIVYLEAYINKEYIGLKYNTTQFYFMLRRADLFWIFSSTSDGSDIKRFSNRIWSLPCALLETCECQRHP